MRHLPVLLGVLLTVQAHTCHVVLQLTQLARQALVAFLVAVLRFGQAVENAFFFLKCFLCSIELAQRFHLCLARSGLLVGFLQCLDISFYLLDDALLPGNLVSERLAGCCCLLFRYGYFLVFLLQLTDALTRLPVLFLQALKHPHLFGKHFLAGTDLRQELLLPGPGLHGLQLALHTVKVSIDTVNHLVLVADLRIDDERCAPGSP